MTTTLTPAERAEINRNNAKKSTGPRTHEGKERSKFNATTHGMAAKTLVLPGEDGAAFARKLDTWMFEWQPASDYEHEMVTRAVRASWMVDRADRAETANLTKNILDAAAADDDRVN